MKFIRITDQQLHDVLWPVLDDDISAIRREEDIQREREEIDRLIDQVSRELATEQRTAAVRMDHDRSDGRWVRRARRRNERAALRSLPTHLFEEGDAA